MVESFVLDSLRQRLAGAYEVREGRGRERERWEGVQGEVSACWA